MATLYDRIFPPRRIELPGGHFVMKPASRAPAIALALVAAVVVSAKVTGFDPAVLVRRGYEFFVILKQMFMPDFSYTPRVMNALADTVKMSIFGSFIGCALGLPFAVVASSNLIKSKSVVWAIRFFLSVVRTLPALIIALLAKFLFNLGTFAGTVAISVFTLGIVAKMMYEHIETIDLGAYEALEALGASRPRAFLTAVLPQILAIYVSTSLYCLEINVRHAAILGYVGAGGLGVIINEKIGFRRYDQVGMVLLMLFLTVLVIENVSRYFRSKLT